MAAGRQQKHTKLIQVNENSDPDQVVATGKVRHSHNSGYYFLGGVGAGLHHTACHILVLQPGTKPGPSHWITSNSPSIHFDWRAENIC